MKELGIYFHGSMGVAVIIEECLTARGVRVTNHEACLCDLDPDKRQLTDRVVLFHPGDNQECWDKSREVITENPATKFYVLCLGRPKRIEGIGEHNNVDYLEHLDQISDFRRGLYLKVDEDKSKYDQSSSK